jgi:hypothetical protein
MVLHLPSNRLGSYFHAVHANLGKAGRWLGHASATSAAATLAGSRHYRHRSTIRRRRL